MQNKLNNSLVVLPTSRAIRESLNQLKSTDQLLQKHLSIGDFFQRAVVDSQNRKFVEKNLKLLFLREAIQTIDIEKLGFSREFTTFLKQSEYIFRFFQELAQEYVAIQELTSHDTYALYEEHLEILETIYKQYTNILKQYNYTDTLLMPQSYILNTDYLEEFDTITLFIEGYLSKFESKILQDISKIQKVILVITLNEFNQKNILLLQEYGITQTLENGYTYTIDLTQREILKKIPNPQPTQKIVISPIGSQIEQIAFIKYHITQMCAAKIAPEKIAVIIPNEKIRAQLELFDEEHYFNFAMGRGLENSQIVQTIKVITKILVDQEPKDLEKQRYLNIDKDIIKDLFQKNWNKEITEEIFENIVQYLFALETDEEILEKLEQIKISMKILLFSQKNSKKIVIKTKECMKLLSTEINAITIDDISGGKITVLGILETRAIAFDGVIVIDFNDQKIPKISIKDKFISSSLKEIVGLPSIQDRENLQRYYYKRLFEKAHNIAICYIEDEQNVMSRFVLQLFEEYKNYLQKNNFQEILYTKNRLHHFYKDIILDIDLSQRAWSATSLKTYLQCKRQYYFQYIANIKQHALSLRPQSYEIGNIIHSCLEEAVRQNNLTNTFINQYCNALSKNNPYLVMELELWKKKLKTFVAYEEIRQQNGIQISEVEKPFNLLYEGINIKGTIDRIDKHPDNTFEIIDYKTSATLKVDTLQTYEKSNDFQLEFYYLSQQDKMIKDVCYYSLSDVSIKKEECLEEKLSLLKSHFSALKTTTVNFECTDTQSACTYCSYKTICNKD